MTMLQAIVTKSSLREMRVKIQGYSIICAILKSFRILLLKEL